MIYLPSRIFRFWWYPTCLNLNLETDSLIFVLVSVFISFKVMDSIFSKKK